jgi:hypothetical protein
VRSNLLPGDIGFGSEQFIHGNGPLFASAATHIGANGLRGDILRSAMQPTGQDRTIRELRCAFCQRDEGGLAHVLGKVRIADHAPRGGVNEIHVPPDQFGERRFGMVFRVGLQQLGVGLVVHSLRVAAAAKIGQELQRQDSRTPDSVE